MTMNAKELAFAKAGGGQASVTSSAVVVT